MKIQDLTDKIIQVENFQATYIVFKVDGITIRFDFVDKKEFRLKKNTIGKMQYFETHPLLTNYNEKYSITYINSKPKDFQRLSDDIQSAINNITLGWRNWTDYVTDKSINFTLDTFKENLKKGAGILSKAPVSITERVINICDDHNVLTKTFTDNVGVESYKLITIDADFVIAKEFKTIN